MENNNPYENGNDSSDPSDLVNPNTVGTVAGLADFSTLIDHVESVSKTFTKSFHDADEHIRTLGLGQSSEPLDRSPGFFTSLFSSDSGGDGSFFDGGGSGGSFR